MDLRLSLVRLLETVGNLAEKRSSGSNSKTRPDGLKIPTGAMRNYGSFSLKEVLVDLRPVLAG